MVWQGHFHLAKANFSNPHRLRYGKDYYDDRMQTSICISDSPEYLFRIMDHSGCGVGPSIQSDALATTNQAFPTSISAQKQAGSGAENVGKAEREARKKDPLNWFGILVPPALRTSQAAFRDVVTRVSQLAVVDTKMRAIEIDIRRARKKLKKVG